MTKKEFKQAIKNLEDFKEIELKKLDNIVAILTDKEFSFSCIGFTFIDKYVDLLAMAIGDEREWIDWFIYACDYGKKAMEAGYDGKTKKIKNSDELYDLIMEGKKR